MVGQTISHYRITEKLGQGGMGVVYRAEDLRLGRAVALKFLRSDLLESAEHKRRFLHEARAAARLDHPNICTVYEIDEVDGQTFLVMPCLEGQTLKQKIADRPLPLDVALNIAIQTGQGLQVAHEKGIIHRDIKPANIMIAPQGQVKIMDFGLAQLSDHTKLTASGTKLGTPAYMSPEQTEGKPTDRRSDVWMLGAVLYEMISGRVPFPGEAEAAVAYAILHTEPEPLTALRSGVPVELDRILAKTLAKGVSERYQHIDELLVDLRAVGKQLESRRPAPPEATSESRKTRTYAYLGAMAVIVVLLLAATLPDRQEAPLISPTEWVQITQFPNSATSPALSPDGRMLTFIRGRNTFFGPGEIYVKMLPDGEAAQLTDDGLRKMSPVFSPDSSRIAYTVVDENFAWDTWLVPALGGDPRHWLPNASGLTWIDDRRLLFSEIKTGAHMALVTATESRAEARDIYLPAHERGMAHRSYLSPDGRTVLVVEMDNQGWRRCRLVPFDGSSPGRRVGPEGACTAAAWSPDGRWMYFSANTGSGYHIWRQQFPEGELQQLTFGPTQQGGIAMAADGRSLLSAVGITQSAVWVRDKRGDRQVSSEGNAFLGSGAPRAFSPDGSKLYYLARQRTGLTLTGPKLWVTDLESGRDEVLLTDFDIASYDISREGESVVFLARDEEGNSRLWLASLDRRSAPRQLPPLNVDTPLFGAADEVYFLAAEGQSNFIYRINEDGDIEKAVPHPILRLFCVSPDGEWLAAWAPSEGDPGAMFAFPTRGDGPGVRICSDCFVSWAGDQRSLFVTRSVYTGRGTFVVSLPPGEALPKLPAGGIESEAQLTSLPGNWLTERDIGRLHPIAGPDASVYAYTRQTTQRNIYQIPLP